MVDAQNIRRSGKKLSKHSTSSASSVASQAGAHSPVIASDALGRKTNHKDDSLSGLPNGNKGTKIRRALAKFNLLPLNKNRCSIGSVC